MSFLFRTTIVMGIVLLLGATAWLAHLRADESGAYLITFASTRSGLSQIYVMSANGASVKQLSNLTNNAPWSSWYSYPNWNARAECIAYDLAPFNKQSLREQCVDLYGNIVPAWNTLDIGVLQQHFSGMYPWIFVTRNNVRWHVGTAENEGIFRLRFDGAEFLQLSSVPGNSLEYLPESDSIQFYYNEKTYIVMFDTSDTIILNGLATDVRISPDHRWIVYELEYSQQVQGRYQRFYYLLNRATTNVYPLTFYRDRPPTWSWDSRYLIYEAFDGLRSFDTLTKREYHIVEIDDQIRSSGYAYTPDFYGFEWSPDRELLAIKLYKDIYIVRPDGTSILNLTDSPLVKNTYVLASGNNYDHMNAHWSPDGEWIVFQSDVRHKTSEIFRVRPDGSDLQNLTNDPNWDVMPSWIPSFEKEWHPEVALTGGLIGLIGLVLSRRLRRGKTA